MNKVLFVLLFIAFAAYGQQQERVAILNTVDDVEPSIGFSDLNYLTDRLRETAVKVLPKQSYGIMTLESIVAFLGSQERMIKECKAASCLAELGRKVSADYVAQARIGRFGKNLTIKTELYSSKSGNLIDSFTGESKDVEGLLDIINRNAPDMFKNMPNVSRDQKTSPFITENINNFEKNVNYELDSEKSYLTNLNTEPPGKISVGVLSIRGDYKKYELIKIGKQIWMAENLNYNANGSKCYNNNTDFCDKYGRLYDWKTAMKVCPQGWHLPTKAEWDILAAIVGGEKTAGKHLKAKFGWNKNGDGLDSYGFSALSGGGGNLYGYFNSVGYQGNWWSSSENGNNKAYRRFMGYGDEFRWYDSVKDDLYSVRCMQD